MDSSDMMQGDEISIVDLYNKLIAGWRMLVGTLAVGIGCSFAGILLLPEKYEAVAVIQVGQIGQVDQVGQIDQVKVNAQPVEHPVQAVERMKAPAFQLRVAKASSDDELLRAITSSPSGGVRVLSLQVIKGTVGPDQVPLIELRAEGESREAARHKAEVAINELVKIHDELALPALTRMRANLAISREKLAGAERELSTLAKLVGAARIKDESFTQLALMTSLRIQKEGDIFVQRQMIAALETALEPPATQSAHAIESVFVPNKPVSPKTGLLLALGCLGGLFAGGALVFLTDALQRARASRK